MLETLKGNQQPSFKNIMGAIYKVTNKTNGKVYIGQTINNPEYRWYHHLEDAKLNSDVKFHKALRKYGKDGFLWETIENVDNNLLNEREIYWINFYDSYKNGYNSTIGGDNPPLITKKVMCVEINVIYESAEEAFRKTGINAGHILECAEHKYNRLKAGGYHWVLYDDYINNNVTLRKSKNELTSKKVIDLNTNIIYDSILAASKATGLSRHKITDICKGTNTTSNEKFKYYILNEGSTTIER